MIVCLISEVDISRYFSYQVKLKVYPDETPHLCNVLKLLQTERGFSFCRLCEKCIIKQLLNLAFA